MQTTTEKKFKFPFKSACYEYTPEHLEAILLVVSRLTDISASDIKGAGRKREVVLARQLYCYLAFKYTRNSLKNIGVFIGGRDHTTVLFAIQTLKDLADTYNKERNLLKSCEDEVGQYYKAVDRTGLKRIFANISVKNTNCVTI